MKWMRVIIMGLAILYVSCNKVTPILALLLIVFQDVASFSFIVKAPGKIREINIRQTLWSKSYIFTINQFIENRYIWWVRKYETPQEGLTTHRMEQLDTASPVYLVTLSFTRNDRCSSWLLQFRRVTFEITPVVAGIVEFEKWSTWLLCKSCIEISALAEVGEDTCTTKSMLYQASPPNPRKKFNSHW